MYKGFKIITFTHKHCNIRDISRYVVQDTGGTSVADTLHDIRNRFAMSELLYLATCNRALYFFYQEENEDTPEVRDLLSFIHPQLHDDELEKAANRAEIFEGADALEHIYEVAASLDSLVIGEREIFRQLKEAYTWCADQKLTGDNIRLVMKFTVQAAKDVYTQTGIAEKPLSVVALAIQKMQELNPPAEARILLIGAGQTNVLVAKFLQKYGYHNVTVFNRSLEKAELITGKFNGTANALPLDELNTWSAGFDILIVCTAAHEAIVHEGNFSQLLNGATDKKLLIDLAMPANIAPEVQIHPQVNYIDIEQLRQLAAENLDYRRAEATHARKILAGHLTKFRNAYHQRMIERAMRDVPEEIKDVRRRLISDVFARELADMDEQTRHIVEDMLDYMEKKCISIPIKAAKKMVVSEG